MFKFRIFLVVFFFLRVHAGFTQGPFPAAHQVDPWVSAEISRMTLREKIGQLIMIDIYPGQSEAHKQDVERLIRLYKPGGILVMNGSPVNTARWINDF